MWYQLRFHRVHALDIFFFFLFNCTLMGMISTYVKLIQFWFKDNSFIIDFYL